MTADSTMIHETAIIAPGAEIGPNVKIGPYSVVRTCQIGEGTVIHPHVVVTGRTIVARIASSSRAPVSVKCPRT